MEIPENATSQNLRNPIDNKKYLPSTDVKGKARV